MFAIILYLYIGIVFPLDDTVNVICIVKQFGSLNPAEIPKKVRWFIVCMQCECKWNGKHKENMDMMNRAIQLEMSTMTSKKGSTKDELTSTNPQSATNPSSNPSIDTTVESC